MRSGRTSLIRRSCTPSITTFAGHGLAFRSSRLLYTMAVPPWPMVHGLEIFHCDPRQLFVAFCEKITRRQASGRDQGTC